eukprot:6425478-Pyramimonas_sp.AAC.1
MLGAGPDARSGRQGSSRAVAQNRRAAERAKPSSLMPNNARQGRQLGFAQQPLATGEGTAALHAGVPGRETMKG